MFQGNLRSFFLLYLFPEEHLVLYDARIPRYVVGILHIYKWLSHWDL